MLKLLEPGLVRVFAIAGILICVGLFVGETRAHADITGTCCQGTAANCASSWSEITPCANMTPGAALSNCVSSSSTNPRADQCNFSYPTGQCCQSGNCIADAGLLPSCGAFCTAGVNFCVTDVNSGTACFCNIPTIPPPPPLGTCCEGGAFCGDLMSCGLIPVGSILGNCSISVGTP